METQIWISLSIALIAGLMLSRLAKKLNLPAVTAYLVAGILVGPFLLGSVEIPIGAIDLPSISLGFSHADIEGEKYSLISNVALGFIAFSIGNEFRIPQLRKIGKQATVIGILQALVTTVLVDGVLIGLSFVIPEL